jgi:hypothetical protein
MSLSPYQVQTPPPVRNALEKQARELGFLTSNQWAAVILARFSQLPAPRAMIALGRLSMVARSRSVSKF